MSQALNLDLGKQKLDGLRRESIKRLQMRSKTRLVYTRGPSRWRINMDCGRPMKSRGDRVDNKCGLKKDQDR